MRFYLTTSIPYVNADPHIGFTLELVQGDALARWRRQKGDEVRFLTGTDENALKNVQAAEAAGRPVADFVAERAERFRELTRVMNISNDDFIRTTEERHVRGAQAFWRALNPGDLYRKEYSGWYCVGCESFITEKDLVNGLCSTHQRKPELITENNYFFRLSKYQDQLLKLVESGKLAIAPDFRKNEVLQFIRQGLEDISISRSEARARNWGVRVPGDESQVMYVWTDALTNYITSLGYGDDARGPQTIFPRPRAGQPERTNPSEKSLASARSGESLFEKWWQEAEVTHMVGKDITRFHAVYWPAFLLSAGLPLPKRILVHGFITSGGQKMSKSLGNVVSPFDYVQEFSADSLRYYLLREIPTLDDGDFTREKFLARYNADLANGLGNLVQRVTAMMQKYNVGAYSNTLVQGELAQKVDSCMSKYQIDQALVAIWETIAACDKRIDESKPWAMAKDESKKDDLAMLLSRLIADIRDIGETLQPFMPATAESILGIVNVEKISPPETPLFPRKS